MKWEQKRLKKEKLRGDALDPLSELNKQLVDNMYKGYSPKKAHKLMKDFHKKGAT